MRNLKSHCVKSDDSGHKLDPEAKSFKLGETVYLMNELLRCHSSL